MPTEQVIIVMSPGHVKKATQKLYTISMKPLSDTLLRPYRRLLRVLSIVLSVVLFFLIIVLKFLAYQNMHNLLLLSILALGFTAGLLSYMISERDHIPPE